MNASHRIIESRLLRRGHARGDVRMANRRAFTLIEILIVLGMLVLLAGITWPVLETQIIGSELPESASRVRDVLYMARAEAAKENRRVRVRFAPGAQQPIIEIERDPIRDYNVWTPVTSAWAEQAMESLLLSDVQVHEIKLGRPEFTKPISISESPEEEKDEGETLKDEEVGALDTEEAFDDLDPSNPDNNIVDADYPVDDYRAAILFDAHGKVTWALITLARRLPEDALEEEDPSSWVLLDGRTGIASVRSPMDEDELADPANYIKRENLYLPELSDLGRLSLKSTGFGGQPAVDDDGDGIPDNVPGGDSGELDGGSGDPMQSGDNPGDSSGSNSPPPSQSDIDDKLDESGLSEAEQNNIRNALGGGRGNQSTGGNRGGGRNGGQKRDNSGGGRK